MEEERWGAASLQVDLEARISLSSLFSLSSLSQRLKLEYVSSLFSLLSQRLKLEYVSSLFSLSSLSELATELR